MFLNKSNKRAGSSHENKEETFRKRELGKKKNGSLGVVFLFWNEFE